jgi:hypothetical protein
MSLDHGLIELINLEAWERYMTPVYTVPGKLPEPTVQHKISICTTCMNRASDLKQTYEQNLQDNMEYTNVEFVLLNYGSSDDLDVWAFKTLLPYIRAGKPNYYRTSEPEYYSMTHSRNIAFKVAAGAIVNNVDADHYTNPGFASYINALANFYPAKPVFVKSRQKNRGRLGMFKEDFLTLGGYDESIESYGFDDHDLLMRAFHTGSKVVRFGGEYMRITEDHRRHPTGNYKISDWRYTQRRNSLISLLNLHHKRYQANENHHWGKAHLIKNFSEELDI